jgi:hypothetical protein
LRPRINGQLKPTRAERKNTEKHSIAIKQLLYEEEEGWGAENVI